MFGRGFQLIPSLPRDFNSGLFAHVSSYGGFNWFPRCQGILTAPSFGSKSIICFWFQLIPSLPRDFNSVVWFLLAALFTFQLIPSLPRDFNAATLKNNYFIAATGFNWFPRCQGILTPTTTFLCVWVDASFQLIPSLPRDFNFTPQFEQVLLDGVSIDSLVAKGF